MAKQPTAAQRRRWSKVAGLGCIICKGLAAIHHCFTGAGGRKDHDKVLPLCGRHHQTGGEGVAIHPFRKQFEANYGTEQELLEKVGILLGENVK